MKSLGSILSAIAPAAPKPTSAAPAPEPRAHKVTLAYMVFAEVEVMAATVEDAFTAAEASAKEAKRTFYTAPVATRAHVRRLIDYREPSKGTEWVELVKRYDDPQATETFRWVAQRD